MHYPLHPAELAIVKSIYPEHLWADVIRTLEETPGKHLAEKMAILKPEKTFDLQSGDR